MKLDPGHPRFPEILNLLIAVRKAIGVGGFEHEDATAALLSVLTVSCRQERRAAFVSTLRELAQEIEDGTVKTGGVP